jgi:hypothetical protein
MSIVSRKEFAAIATKSYNYINVYIGRGKIVVIDDGPNKGKIDTDDPTNAKFLASAGKKAMSQKTTTKKSKSTTSSQAEPEEKAWKDMSLAERKQRRKEKRDEKAKADKAKKRIEWEERKEKANAIKAEREAQLKTLQVEKMMGQLMPVDLVHQIIKINVQNVFVSFENELQNIASIYCDILAGGDRKKLAEIVDKMRQELERIIKNTKTNARQEIESVVEDYADTRSRGERK